VAEGRATRRSWLFVAATKIESADAGRIVDCYSIGTTRALSRVCSTPSRSMAIRRDVDVLVGVASTEHQSVGAALTFDGVAAIEFGRPRFDDDIIDQPGCRNDAEPNATTFRPDRARHRVGQ
jgi:hypothetical protein